MRILGIDPGTHYTGIGVIEVSGNSYRMVSCETVTVPEKLSIPAKLNYIYQTILNAIRRYKPDRMALEGFLFGKDIRAVVRLGEARACAMLAAIQEGIEIFEYTPTRIKQAVTGNGRASKEQIQHMVKILLGLKSHPKGDGADALAVAICHGHDQGYAAILGREVPVPV